MKILKHKNIMQIIYGVLLLMPFLAILGRTAYVVVNKNAYQSYYGETINEKTLTPTNYDNLVVGNTYEISAINIGSQSADMGGNAYKLAITNAEFLNYEPSIDMNDVNGLAFYSTSSGTSYINLMNNNTQMLSINSGQNYILRYQLESKNLVGTSITLFNMLNNNYVEYNKNSYLDNVFEYSVSQFTEDNNFGRLDLSSWFTDMFLDDNVHNNLYVNFVNWYLNYAMLVSLMHFLFLVLMWFVNYSRRLLERGMNYDW